MLCKQDARKGLGTHGRYDGLSFVVEGGNNRLRFPLTDFNLSMPFERGERD